MAGPGNRLVGSAATDETADAWIVAWDTKTAEDGFERGSGYWQRPARTGSLRNESIYEGPSRMGGVQWPSDHLGGEAKEASLDAHASAYAQR